MENQETVKIVYIVNNLSTEQCGALLKKMLLCLEKDELEHVIDANLEVSKTVPAEVIGL